MGRPTSRGFRKAITWLAIVLMAVDTVYAGHLLGKLRSGCGPVRRIASHVRCRGGLLGGIKARIHSGASCSAASSSVSCGDPCVSDAVVSSGEIISDGYVSSGEIISSGEIVSSGEVISEGYVSSGEVISDGYISSGEVISDGYVSSGEVISDGYISSGEVISEGYVSSGEVISDGYASEGYVSSGEVISDGYVDSGYVSDGYSSGEVISEGVVSDGYSVYSGGEVISEGCTNCASNVTDGMISEGVVYDQGSSGYGPSPLGPNETVIEEATIVSVTEGASTTSTAEPTPAATTDTTTPPAPVGGDDSDLFTTPADTTDTATDLAPADPGPAEPDPAGAASDLFGGPATDPAPAPTTPDPVTPDAGGDASDLFGPSGDTEPAPVDPPAEGSSETLDDLFGSAAATGENADTMAYRNWTDDSGSFSTEAMLQNVSDSGVRLLKSNGKECTVSFARLSRVDLEYVQQQASHFGVAGVNLIAANR